MGKKQTEIKEILQRLLDTNKLTGFTRTEIDKVIKKVRWVDDQRAIDNTFNMMFSFDFFTQPKCGIFDLNLKEIATLELTIPNNQQQLDVGRE